MVRHERDALVDRQRRSAVGQNRTERIVGRHVQGAWPGVEVDRDVGGLAGHVEAVDRRILRRLRGIHSHYPALSAERDPRHRALGWNEAIPDDEDEWDRRAVRDRWDLRQTLLERRDLLDEGLGGDPRELRVALGEQVVELTVELAAKPVVHTAILPVARR